MTHVFSCKVLVHVLAALGRIVIEKEWLPIRLHLNAGFGGSLLEVPLANVAPRSDGVRDERDAKEIADRRHNDFSCDQ